MCRQKTPYHLPYSSLAPIYSVHEKHRYPHHPCARRTRAQPEKHRYCYPEKPTGGYHRGVGQVALKHTFMPVFVEGGYAELFNYRAIFCRQ
jgi:hypothetical protein